MAHFGLLSILVWFVVHLNSHLDLFLGSVFARLGQLWGQVLLIWEPNCLDSATVASSLGKRSSRMGKYMKKARGVGGGMAVMEVMAQGQSGVRTRARAQAMEKKEVNSNSSSSNKGSSSTSTKGCGPAQISYLELRNRRLEKTVGCNNRPCAGRKSTSVDEYRRLSDLTNSDMLADDCSSRLALSAEEAHKTRMARRHQTCDENRGFSYHLQHEDKDVEGDDSLHRSVRRSLQQLRNSGSSRGRAPPGAAHSRSNSRSNSVTRELPLSGILTRNQRKLEKQISGRVGDMDVEMDALCSSRHVHHAGANPNSHGTRHGEVEVSFGENPIDEAPFVRDSESTPISHARDVDTPVSATRLQSELAGHGMQAGLSNVQSPMDMEIEDFFLQAEQKEQRRFMERYNFDPVNDTPLQGRYEWVSWQPHL